MDSEIVKYLLFIPFSVLLKYIESRYLSDVRKRKNLFENIPNESIHQCITRYQEFETKKWQAEMLNRLIPSKFYKNNTYVILLGLVSLFILITDYCLLIMPEHSYFSDVLFPFINSTVTLNFLHVQKGNLNSYTQVEFFYNYLVLTAVMLITVGGQLNWYVLFNKIDFFHDSNIDLKTLKSWNSSLKERSFVCDIILIESIFIIMNEVYKSGFRIDSSLNLILLIIPGFLRTKMYYTNKDYNKKLKQYINEEYKKNYPFITVFTKDSQIARGKIESVFTGDVIYLNDGEETSIVNWESVDTLHIENRYIILKRQQKHESMPIIH